MLQSLFLAISFPFAGLIRGLEQHGCSQDHKSLCRETCPSKLETPMRQLPSVLFQFVFTPSRLLSSVRPTRTRDFPAVRDGDVSKPHQRHVRASTLHNHWRGFHARPPERAFGSRHGCPIQWFCFEVSGRRYVASTPASVSPAPQRAPP
jgi:hypothetical protein